MREARLTIAQAYESRRMSLRDSIALTEQEIDEDAKRREDTKIKLSKISSVNAFEKRGGKIMHFNLDTHQKSKISMEEMILIGYQASQ